MKTNQPLTKWIVLLALSTFTTFYVAQPSTIFAQGTAFTHQGRLNDGANPAQGIYDLRFAIYDSATNGNVVAGPVTNSAIAVSNGLFTVTLDFGSGVFNGNPRWLDTAVRTNGATTFTALAQRQMLAPTPYAMFANSASNLLGTLPANQLSGTAGNFSATNIYFSGSITGNGAGLTNLNAANLTGSASNLTLTGNLYLPNTGIIYSGGFPFIHDHGNANFFAGTYAGNLTTTGDGGNTGVGYGTLYSNTTGSDNTACGTEALSANTIGSDNTANGAFALYVNTSGSNNTANGYQALFSNMSGYDNTANGYQALYNNTNGYYNTAVGHLTLYDNTSGSYNVAVGDGALELNVSSSCNTAVGYWAMVGNTTGIYNTANGNGALAGNTSGSFNIALGSLAGYNLTTGSNNIDIGNMGVAGESGIIRLGTPGTHTNTFIAGVLNGNGAGLTNVIASGISGTITLAQLPGTVLTNGEVGTVTINGNIILPSAATTADTIYSGNAILLRDDTLANFFAGGSAGNLTLTGIENTGIGLMALNAETSGSLNTAIGCEALAANNGGSNNVADGALALCNNRSGNNNTANGYAALQWNTTGSNNIALGYQAGYNLTTNNNNIDIGNTGVAGESGVIRIGTPGTHTTTYLTGSIQTSSNLFMNDQDIQLRGDLNHGVGWYGAGKLFAGVGPDGPVLYGWDGGGLGTMGPQTIALYWNYGGQVGIGTTAPQSALHVRSSSSDCEISVESGDSGGHRWTLQSTGTSALAASFQIIDRTANTSRLLINTNGNVGIGTTSPGYPLTMGGGAYCTGSQWQNGCDRNLKENFQPADVQTIFEKVVALPVTTWNYKNENASVKHLGPTAQDFKAAFDLGDNDKAIGTVDESGVALAAIQGLNQKLEQKDAQIQSLEKRLSELETLVKKLAQTGK